MKTCSAAMHKGTGTRNKVTEEGICNVDYINGIWDVVILFLNICWYYLLPGKFWTAVSDSFMGKNHSLDKCIPNTAKSSNVWKHDS